MPYTRELGSVVELGEGALVATGDVREITASSRDSAIRAVRAAELSVGHASAASDAWSGSLTKSCLASSRTTVACMSGSFLLARRWPLCAFINAGG